MDIDGPIQRILKLTARSIKGFYIYDIGIKLKQEVKQRSEEKQSMEKEHRKWAQIKDQNIINFKNP